MARRTPPRLSGEIVETVTLAELCRAGGFHAAWVVELVDYGVLDPKGRTEADWRFEGASVVRAVKAWRLHRDLGVNLPGVALALALMEERDRLKRRFGRIDPFS